MAVNITDHNGNPLSLTDAVSGEADTHNPDVLARIAGYAHNYSRLQGKDTVVHWHEGTRQWWWNVAEEPRR